MVRSRVCYLLSCLCFCVVGFLRTGKCCRLYMLACTLLLITTRWNFTMRHRPHCYCSVCPSILLALRFGRSRATCVKPQSSLRTVSSACCVKVFGSPWTMAASCHLYHVFSSYLVCPTVTALLYNLRPSIIRGPSGEAGGEKAFGEIGIQAQQERGKKKVK